MEEEEEEASQKAFIYIMRGEQGGKAMKPTKRLTPSLFFCLLKGYYRHACLKLTTKEGRKMHEVFLPLYFHNNASSRSD